MKIKQVKASPGAKRMIRSLSDLGYECSTAIADVIDNSIAADASEIYVDIVAAEGSRPAYVIIADNGSGMDKDELLEAMRYGSDQQYDSNDLGKFGLGLKTASLSQCKTLTVASKPKPKKGGRSRRSIMQWDLDHVYKTNDWNLLTPDPEQLDSWMCEALDHSCVKNHGTVVIWSNLEEKFPLLSSKQEGKKQRYLADLLAEVGSHLRMVFHAFMQKRVPRKRKLKIFLAEDDVPISPWDPFCLDESKTTELSPKHYKVSFTDESGKQRQKVATVTPFILPKEDEFSSREAWRDASGPKSWNQQQGLYFYRNGRLLQAGGWSRLRAIDEHTKLLRIEIDFPSELDKAFSINVTKMKALIPSDIREDLKKDVAKWVKSARNRYDKKRVTQGNSTGRATKATAQTTKNQNKSPDVKTCGVTLARSNMSSSKLTVTKAGKAGDLRIVVPPNHYSTAIFEGSNGKLNEARDFCRLLLTMLEALQERRMKPSDIPLKKLLNKFRKI